MMMVAPAMPICPRCGVEIQGPISAFQLTTVLVPPQVVPSHVCCSSRCAQEFWINYMATHAGTLMENVHNNDPMVRLENIRHLAHELRRQEIRSAALALGNEEMIQSTDCLSHGDTGASSSTIPIRSILDTLTSTEFQAIVNVLMRNPPLEVDRASLTQG